MKILVFASNTQDASSAVRTLHGDIRIITSVIQLRLCVKFHSFDLALLDLTMIKNSSEFDIINMASEKSNKIIVIIHRIDFIKKYFSSNNKIIAWINYLDPVYKDRYTEELLTYKFLVSEQGRKKYPWDPERNKFGDLILLGKDWREALSISQAS